MVPTVIPITIEFLGEKKPCAIAVIDNNIHHGLFALKTITKHMRLYNWFKKRIRLELQYSSLLKNKKIISYHKTQLVVSMKVNCFE